MFSPDGRRVAQINGSQIVCWHETRTGRLLGSLPGRVDDQSEIAFSSDGTRLLTCESPATACLWDLAKREKVAEFSAPAQDLRRVLFVEGDKQVVVLGWQSSPDRYWIGSWDLETRAAMTSLSVLHEFQATSFSKDGRFVSVVEEGRNGRQHLIRSTSTGEIVRELRGFDDGRVEFSPRGHWLAIQAEQDSFGMLSLGSETADFPRHGGWVWGLAFSPDGRRIASVSWDRTLRVWDTASGAELHRWTMNGRVSCVAWSPSGSRIVAGTMSEWSGCGALVRIDLATGSVSEEAIGESLQALSHSPREDRLGGIVASGWVEWDRDGPAGSYPRPEAPWRRERDYLSFRSILDDGRDPAPGCLFALEYGEAGTTVRALCESGVQWVWSDRSTPPLAHGVPAPAPWWAIAMAPGGDVELLMSNEGALRLIEQPSGNLLPVLLSGGESERWHPQGFTAWTRGHPRYHWREANRAAFSPDGRLAAAGLADGRVRLWEVPSGNPRAALTGHQSYVTSVSFSADGARLATGSADGTIVVWEVPRD